MKTTPEPLEVLETLAENLNRAYQKLKHRPPEGTVQLHLKHDSVPIDCYMKFHQEGVSFFRGTTETPTVTLRSNLYDWLRLASGELNPFLGVITGRLRFSGNTSFLYRVMSEDLFYVDVSQYDDPSTEFEKNPSRYWSIPESVVVINSSPRAEGGYTDFYLRAFVEGIKKVVQNIDVFYLSKLKINSCTGCWSCWLTDSGECVYRDRDDFGRVYQRYARADLIVFAFPLYIDSVPALLKAFLERTTSAMYPYMIKGPERTRHPRRYKRDQAAAVFSVSGFPEMENFKAVKMMFRQFSHNSHIPIVAEIFRPAGMYLYNNPLLYRKLNQVLEALKTAGEEIARKGRVSRKTLKSIQQRVDRASRFRRLSNFFWKERIRNKEKNY